MPGFYHSFVIGKTRRSRPYKVILHVVTPRRTESLGGANRGGHRRGRIPWKNTLSIFHKREYDTAFPAGISLQLAKKVGFLDRGAPLAHFFLWVRRHSRKAPRTRQSGRFTLTFYLLSPSKRKAPERQWLRIRLFVENSVFI